MTEHGWPGWPDDPTGGEPTGGGLPEPAPEHGWTADEPWTDRYDPDRDDDGHHDDGHHDDGHHGDPPGDGDDRLDPAGPDAAPPEVWDHEPDGPGPAEAPAAGATTMGPVGTDPDAVPEPDAPAAFPPTVDVGALPEPVDGFPWIDTGSLGLAAPGGADPTPVTAEQLSADLAAHAATDLPPAGDPWAHLAASDDPATSALARWWAPGT